MKPYNNRFGYCWKMDYSGKRQTPYFATKEDAIEFIKYFEKNLHKYKSHNDLKFFVDLMFFEYTEIVKITKDFEKECNIKGIVYVPNDETLYEFFGLDMEEYVGYEVSEIEDITSA